MTRPANLLTRLLIVVVVAATLTVLVVRIADQQPDSARAMVLTGIGVPIAVGIALLFAKILVLRPMRRLVAAAERWSSDDTAARIAAGAASKDEFVQLTAAFERMADTVERQRVEAARLRAPPQQRATEPLRVQPTSRHGVGARDNGRAGQRIAFVETAPVRARLLIVDDDADVRGMAGEMLREFGHAVVLAADGADALATLERDSDFALMLVDYAMPGLNGLMLIEAVEARYPKIRTLLVTGYAELAEADAMPAERILRKPFTIASLLSRVQQALSEALVPAPAPPAAR